MMPKRDILFRGKQLGNGEWVIGDLLRYNDGTTLICCEDFVPDVLTKYEVDPSTVCQYTGLTDMRGNKIFEWDIVKWGHVPGYHETPVRIATVRMDPDILFDAIISDRRTVFHYGAFMYAGKTDKALEVIGNHWEEQNDNYLLRCMRIHDPGCAKDHKTRTGQGTGCVRQVFGVRRDTL